MSCPSRPGNGLHYMYAYIVGPIPELAHWLQAATATLLRNWAWLNSIFTWYRSWYPRKPELESTSGVRGHDAEPTQPPLILPAPPPLTANFKLKQEKEEESRRHQLEIAKTMVMELSQPRSPARNLGSAMQAGHTPSPKPSPNRAKSSLIKSRKACSSSPADRDGYYPCNRCGR